MKTKRMLSLNKDIINVLNISEKAVIRGGAGGDGDGNKDYGPSYECTRVGCYGDSCGCMSYTDCEVCGGWGGDDGHDGGWNTADCGTDGEGDGGNDGDDDGGGGDWYTDGCGL